MAAITATAQPTNVPPRVDVSLSAWSADGPVTVQRVHADTSIHQIYMPDVSGGVSQVYDYEAPFGQPFAYQAMNGATLIASASVTLAVTDAWLSAPGLPQFAVVIDPDRKPDRQRTRPQGQLWPHGRPTPITRSGVLRSDSFRLTVRTRTDDEAVDLEAVIEAAPRPLLRIPGIRQPWRYVDCAGFSETQTVHFTRPAGDAAGSVGDWADWELSLTTAGDPVAKPFGDPSASYQALVDSGKTYQQLLDWKGAGATTYLDVLRGGF